MVKTERQRGSTASASAAASTSAAAPSASRSTKKSAQQRGKPASCLVCKFRRVKCDGARPECGQCRQVKRVCHGYPEDSKRAITPATSISSTSIASSSTQSRHVEIKSESSFDEDQSNARALALRTPPRTPEPEQYTQEPAIKVEEHAERSASVSTAPSSSSSQIMSSSAPSNPPTIATLFNKPELTTPEDCLIHMYRNRTMPALHPLSTGGTVGEWRRYLIQAVESDRTLRYIASALATYHDNFLSSSQSSVVLANKYYTKGLSSMSSSFAHASLDPDALMHLMMSASVLIAVEYFRRNFSAIKVHLQSIIKVLGERPSASMTPPLILAERFYRRTYVYFTFFPALYPSFNTLTREDVQHRSWLPDNLPTTFSSMHEADQVLHDLFWPWMFFFQSLDRAPHLALLPQAQFERNALLAAWTTWSNAFESFLGRAWASLPADQQVLADVFRLWSTTTRLRLAHALAPEQRPHDAHLPVFRAMVGRAFSIDARTVRATRVSLEPVLSYMTPAFFVIVHCRDPRVRRDALAAVNRSSITHAQWHPPAVVRAGLRIVEMEERGWAARDDESVERRKIVQASDICEEDRLRDVRLNIDVARGVVEIGAVVWMGPQEGWVQRREELGLPGQ